MKLGVMFANTAASTPETIVVRASGAAADEADLIEHCRAELATYKSPRSVEFRDSLPLSAAGKILKKVLRDEQKATAS